MKNISTIEHFWDELARVVKEYWIQVALFCVFAAIVFFIMQLFFNW